MFQLPQFSELGVSGPGSWYAPVTMPTLDSATVHLWQIRLDGVVSVMPDLEGVLNAEELARAGRFRQQRDRNFSIAARGYLRWFLSAYLNQRAASLEFQTNEFGKPDLANCFQTAPPIRFNIAHSGNRLVFGFSLGREIGIDVEFMRPFNEMDQFAKSTFSVSEQRQLRSLPAELKRSGFFACWTRKEAFIKACGQGLSMPLDRFDVSVHPNESARLLAVAGNAHAGNRWGLYDFEVGANYRAAVVIEMAG